MLSTKMLIVCIGICAYNVIANVVVFASVTDKSDHLVQSNIACILLSLGRFEESLLPANKACELQPDWPKVCSLSSLLMVYSVSTFSCALFIDYAVYSQ